MPTAKYTRFAPPPNDLGLKLNSIHLSKKEKLEMFLSSDYKKYALNYFNLQMGARVELTGNDNRFKNTFHEDVSKQAYFEAYLQNKIYCTAFKVGSKESYIERFYRLGTTYGERKHLEPREEYEFQRKAIECVYDTKLTHNLLFYGLIEYRMPLGVDLSSFNHGKLLAGEGKVSSQYIAVDEKLFLEKDFEAIFTKPLKYKIIEKMAFFLHYPFINISPNCMYPCSLNKDEDGIEYGKDHYTARKLTFVEFEVADGYELSFKFRVLLTRDYNEDLDIYFINIRTNKIITAIINLNIGDRLPDHGLKQIHIDHNYSMTIPEHVNHIMDTPLNDRMIKSFIKTSELTEEDFEEKVIAEGILPAQTSIMGIFGELDENRFSDILDTRSIR